MSRHTHRAQFQFGYEVEYLLNKFIQLPLDLKWMAVIQADQPWLALTPQQRHMILKKNYESSEYGKNLQVFSEQNFECLTEPIFFDDNGNLEVRSKTFDSVEEMTLLFNQVLATFGEGSLQATVSLPHEDCFQSVESAAELLGLLNFLHEMDCFERLYEGAQRYQAGLTNQPMRPFLHAHLGPMNARRHKKLVKYLKSNAIGDKLSPADLVRVGKREQSFKYIGSTVYRPDIAGPDRMTFEIRDAHNSVEKLLNKLHRMLFFLNRPSTCFKQFSNLLPFDSEACWDQLPENLKLLLIETFPNQAPRHIQQFPEPLFMYDVYRNFALPFRPWSEDLACFGLISCQKVEEAQRSYLERLNEICVSSSNSQEASEKIQQAICLFADESEIYLNFKRLESDIVNQ